MMYALLARAADTYLKDRADGAIHEATVLYGRQRGQRMRARALEKGIPLDMAGYFALREWNPDPGDFDSETEQKAPCLITRQKLCPWTQAWKLFSMEKYGALYCRDVDWAILNGFEPSLRLELESTLSAGACCCRFTYPQACQDAAFEAQQEKWAALAGADAVQPFAYHTAHVYCAFRQVMRDYGEAGEKVMEQAQADFKSYYTERVWNEIDLDVKIIPLREDFTLHVDDYMDFPGTIVIANPNAPTGIAVPRNDIQRLLEANPDRVVIVDEAYVDFGAESCVPMIDRGLCRAGGPPRPRPVCPVPHGRERRVIP